jgi:serine O-acetyltransferase
MEEHLSHMGDIIGLIKLIKSDFRRFRIEEENGLIRTLFFSQAFAAILVFRISNFLFYKVNFPIIRHVFLFFAFLQIKFIEITTGISIPARCQIGKGFFISHFGGIIINSKTTIGENCNLSQGVTIGITHGGKNPGVPSIGNRVYIGPSAIIIGGIEIGDDAAIGAGAIVTKSVPPRAVVVGNPGKIISFKGSFDYVHYDNMDSDQSRLESLTLSQIEP